MRIVGFLVLLIIVVWVVGSLVNLYIDRVRRRKDDDAPGDDRDVRRRMREIDDAKQRARGDDIPPW
jgi:Na+-transporting methylmalonyl-CoA/oxaloacetate decarboxylase gamma subunit